MINTSFSAPTWSAPQPPAQPAAGAPATPAPAPAPKKTTADYSLPRKAVEGLAGIAGGFVGTAVNTIPSAFAGGIQGVSREGDADEVGNVQTVFLVIESTAAGTVVGACSGGVLGGAIGLGVGLVGGLIFGALQHTGKGAEKIGEAIKNKVDPAVADNEPSGSRTRDVSKDFSEGAVTGAIAGGKAAFGVGGEEARGVASGLIEGGKGILGVVTNRWEPAETGAQDKPDRQGVVGFILGIPRVILGTAMGIGCGAAGAALTAVDGLIQGFGQGASKSYEGSKGLHRFIIRAELLGAGITAGAITAGPVGALAGGVAGLLTGIIVGRLQNKTGSDRAIVDCVARNVQGAASDNAEGGGKAYEAFRDGLEGGIVGTAAGVKAGFVSGWEGGKGTVDGVFDGVKGVIEGIIGAFGGGKKPTPPQQPTPPAQP